MLAEQEKHDEALSVAEGVLQVVPETDQLGRALVLARLGELHQAQGRNDEALRYARQVLPVYRQELGEDSPRANEVRQFIGDIHYERGAHDEALRWYGEVLASWERSQSPAASESLGAFYTRLGNAYWRKGDPDVAVKWYDKSRQTWEQVLGPKHPYVATAYTNIGASYASIGKFDVALEWQRNALKARAGASEKEGVDGTIWLNLGNALAGKGEYGEAPGWFQKATVVWEQLFGENDPSTALGYNNIGGAYAKTGKYRQSLEWLGKALAVRTKLLGEDHAETKETKRNIELVCELEPAMAKEYPCSAVVPASAASPPSGTK